MRGLPGLEVCLRWGILAASVVLPGTVSAAERPGLHTTLEKKWERLALEHALRGAGRRLERRHCRKIFSDFKDASGRSLQETLDAAGQTPSGYLWGWIFFADGRELPGCGDERVLAVTQPGSRSVWICGESFSREDMRDRGYLEVVLIHELLHVLGLGENPPSSDAIMRQVIARCGS